MTYRDVLNVENILSLPMADIQKLQKKPIVLMTVWMMQNPLINGKTGITLTMMKNTMRMKMKSPVSINGTV